MTKLFGWNISVTSLPGGSAGRLFFLALIVLVALTGCRSVPSAVVERGNDAPFRPGHPEVYTEAIALIDAEDKPYLNLSLNVKNRSLVRRSTEAGTNLNFSVIVEIYKVEGTTTSLIQRVGYDEIIPVNPDDFFDFGEDYFDNRQLPLPEENMLLEVWFQVTYNNSGLETVQRNYTSVTLPDGATPGVSSISLFVMDTADSLEFRNHTSHIITSEIDSIQFQYQLVQPEQQSDAMLVMNLYKFPADRDPARHLSDTFVGLGTLWYRGIEYQRPERIASIERELITEFGPITFDYKSELPEPGNYRFEVIYYPDGTDGERVSKLREFRVTAARKFPQIETVQELRDPLVYLMTTREYEALKEIDDTEELKETIDAFWLRNMDNAQQAQQVIELYYSRVEQANLQFSNFKDGWKTDMGFVYIMFGPPMYVDRALDRMVWRYSYSDVERVSTFTFVRPKLNDEFFPFHHYVLERRRDYHSVEYNRIQSWLSGHILSLQY